MTVDSDSAHPVIELMRQRKHAHSKPGNRKDSNKLALVIEGGGMRGIVSAGMASAIEQLGYLDTVDEIYGTSAGALNGAFLLAGQANWCCTLYYDYLNRGRFFDLNRLLVGKPAIDMEWLARDAYGHERRLDYDAILNNYIPLHCMATEVKTGKTVDLTGFKTKQEIESALLATSRIPFLAGDPHEHDGQKYIDAGLTEPIPLEAAMSNGATHILIFHTRPKGIVVKQNLLDPVIERYLQQISPAIEDLYEERVEKYRNTLRFLDTVSQNPNHTPAICNIRMPMGTETIASLEKDASKLVTAAGAGLKLAQELLTGEAVVVERVLKAFPASWYQETIKD